ncbi:DUF1190 domain-containing protein [Pseudomonas otitidis]|uniref:DUF1190 domain-containing protein n=1 Tax=Metapseudomonas otitidis TaxID=319939 RepID=A0ABU3XU26_9GAMM|nr:DUF1190 domain-containing protein [Pseudomonas otitidis]MDV3441403.1 DUF1190 domain-containing protein [Pseudomonas otitidis]WMR33354.1 DUF1190 domain-containing protein [Pseudomonas otitidis]
MSSGDAASAPAAAPSDPVPASVRRQKRAGLLTLSLMGATPLVLLAWDPMYREVRVFDSLAVCEQGTTLTAEQCLRLRDEAFRRTALMAPVYTSFLACERDFIRINANCTVGEWCEADAVQSCTQGDDGLARPQPVAFLVSDALVRRLRSGEPEDWSEVGLDELQPVFGMSEDTLYGSGTYVSGHYGGYYGSGGRNLHLFTGQGQYLGDQRTRQASVHRSQLQASGYAQQFQSGQLPTRLQGVASRGGFGATARSSLAMASG